MDQEAHQPPKNEAVRRVAFFGGSFDPPHLGHLAIARAAQAALALDTVLFAPVGAQPLKPRGSTAAFAHRVEMTRLAIADEPGFALSLADAPQPSGAPNYTLETLLKLRAELPPRCELFCLMGADSFAAFRRWHRAAEIPFAASLIVASRPGENLNDLQGALPAGLSIVAIPDQDDPQDNGTLEQLKDQIQLRWYILRNPAGEQAPFFMLPNLEIEISASAIRQQIRASAQAPRPERALLPAPVLEYIRAHNLYRDLPRRD
jgi:nicotinate-nucleotide adenylyltransferase